MKEENKDRSELLAFLEFMSRKGLNTTAQRRIIADAFFELPGHHSLEEFYQHVQKLDPRIGQTTVYRTLKLHVESDADVRGVISAVNDAVELRSFREIIPSMNDIFIRAVNGSL